MTAMFLARRAARAPAPHRPLGLAAATALAALLAAPASARITWHEGLAQALASAKDRKTLVLVDFYAPWCYSCYYMDQHVLNQPELGRLMDKLELVKLDVDAPEGAAAKRERRVSFLPTYVILNGEGAEVGRILGEQPRGAFFTQLRDILKRNATLDEVEAALRAAAAGAKPPRSAVLTLAREALRLHARRKTAAEGLKLVEGLPEGLRGAVAKDPEAGTDLLRLMLNKSLESKDAPECLATGRLLLARDLGCSLPYDAQALNACIQPLAEAERAPVYEAESRQLAKLLDRKVFGKPAERCADFRSPVELAADLKGLARFDAAPVLERAIALLQRELGGDMRRDRSKADNLRVFLDLAGREADLERLYPRLIEAYPEDHVYAYRFARFLSKKGRAEEALAQLDAARKTAYGANRLRIAAERARVLDKLGRRAQALAEVEAALKDNPASFPDETVTLTRLKAELSKPTSP